MTPIVSAARRDAQIAGGTTGCRARRPVARDPRLLILANVLIVICTPCFSAEESEEEGKETSANATTANQPSDPAPAQTSVATEAVAAPKQPDLLTISRSPGANRHPDRPTYVRTLDTLLDDEEYSWLELGLEHRSRFEIRDDFFRFALESDEQFLLRTRAYVGIREIADPFRFGFEFQDSRVFDSSFPETTRSINETDIQQLFGELHLANLIEDTHPVRVQFGRLSFDGVDRRLLARNRFRNTTNAFDGGRIRVGSASSPWEVDVFLTQPVERKKRNLDSGDDERLFGGVNGYWRGWGRIAVVEPYYFLLDEDRKTDRPDREIHTLGVHNFGILGDSGFDYDTNVAFQIGESGDGDHLAFAAHAEIGYSIDHDWKPRVALWFNYASGDEDPDDDDDERFDSLFGAAHAFYGFSDIFSWQNLINPALYFAMRPLPDLRIDGAYRIYWLASDKDSFIRAGLRDPTGEDSAFLGQELDLRARYRVFEHWSLEIGYAHFFPGDFVKDVSGSREDSDFFYVSTVLKL